MTTRVAVLASSSRSWLMNRIVLGDSRILALEPDLAGYVEEVVRLVEQQHLVRPGEEVLQHQPLLLTTAERGQVAVLRLLVADAERGGAAGVPHHLDLVAAGVGELGQRRRVGHLRRLVVDVHQLQLEPVDLRSRGPDPRWRDREEEVGHRARADADHLPHDAETAGHGDRARVRRELPGDDPQQRGLAGTVGAHQRDLGAVPDAEGHVLEQHPSVGQLVANSGYLHVTHVVHSPGCRAGPPMVCCCAALRLSCRAWDAKVPLVCIW